MSGHPGEDELIRHLDGPDERLARHLAECAPCRERLDRLGMFVRELAAVQGEAPERGEGYGARVWRRLEPRLDAPGLLEKARASLRALLAPRALGMAGALATVAVAAFLAGRLVRPAPISPAAREKLFLTAVSEHQQRSRGVLLELANTEGNGGDDERRRAGELVLASRLYRQTAVRNGDAAVAAFLDDLERLLVEVANAPADAAPEELEAFRARLEKQGAVFKTRILGARIERSAAPRPAAGRT